MSEHEVLIRILFRHNQGWFSSLMPYYNDANITTFNGNTLVLVPYIIYINYRSIYKYHLEHISRSAVGIVVFVVSHNVLVDVKLLKSYSVRAHFLVSFTHIVSYNSRDETRRSASKR